MVAVFAWVLKGPWLAPAGSFLPFKRAKRVRQAAEDCTPVLLSPIVLHFLHGERD